MGHIYTSGPVSKALIELLVIKRLEACRYRLVNLLLANINTFCTLIVGTVKRGDVFMSLQDHMIVM